MQLCIANKVARHKKVKYKDNNCQDKSQQESKTKQESKEDKDHKKVKDQDKECQDKNQQQSKTKQESLDDKLLLGCTFGTMLVAYMRKRVTVLQHKHNIWINALN